MDILLGLASFAAFYFVWRTIVLTKRVEQLSKELIVSRYVSINDEGIAKDNFFKFISDSRDWAFEYIDTVQKGLKDFIDIADKEFAHFDEFGILTEQYPNYEAMKTISAEYKKLKVLLPEENRND